MLKLKMFRPFPAADLRRILGPVSKVVVIDRNFSFGAGGIFAQEIKAALCNLEGHPQVLSYVAGLGGRDITPETLKEIYQAAILAEGPGDESIWIGLT
jgi:pyruvate/2-oxoacid:ferredoxin oxidoreductase alpha subunit